MEKFQGIKGAGFSAGVEYQSIYQVCGDYSSMYYRLQGGGDLYISTCTQEGCQRVMLMHHIAPKLHNITKV